MASIGHDPNGHRRILFVASDEPTLKSLALYQKHGRMKNDEVVRLY